mgnify:CR=1 FL=1
MNNLQAISEWTPFAADNYAGGVTPADSPAVNFWFAANGETADRQFHCFGNGGDGSLLAVYAPDGKFEQGPVVHLGHEGEVYVVADDVPHALALIAASGNNYEALLYVVAGSEPEPLTADEGLKAWVKAKFSLDVPADPIAEIKAADARHGDRVRKAVSALNDG